MTQVPAPTDEVAGHVTVTPLRTPQDLETLAPSWESLLAGSASDTIFLTPDWIVSWWAAYAGGRELLAMRVHEGDRLVGLAFLYRKEAKLVRGIRHRALALVGDGSADSDYLDWISEPGREAEVVDAILRYARTRVAGWDLLLLNEIPETSPHLAPLESRVRSWGWRWRVERVPCARVSLPDSWDRYLKTLKPRMRTKIRSVLREMDTSFQARYDRSADLGDLDARLASLYDLHNRRWESEGTRGIFHAEEKRTFYALLSRRLMARDRLRFYSLQIDGRYVAHQYCFEYRGCMFLLQEGLDPEWFQHGAGNALRAHVFQDCIARGLEAYDFLGGVTPHKLSWGAGVTWSVRVTTGPPSLRNRILFGVRDARALAKRILRPERAATSPSGTT